MAPQRDSRVPCPHCLPGPDCSPRTSRRGVVLPLGPPACPWDQEPKGKNGGWAPGLAGAGEPQARVPAAWDPTLHPPELLAILLQGPVRSGCGGHGPSLGAAHHLKPPRPSGWVKVGRPQVRFKAQRVKGLSLVQVSGSWDNTVPSEPEKPSRLVASCQHQVPGTTCKIHFETQFSRLFFYPHPPPPHPGLGLFSLNALMAILRRAREGGGRSLALTLHRTEA